jgi:hypothetical protein
VTLSVLLIVYIIFGKKALITIKIEQFTKYFRQVGK